VRVAIPLPLIAALLLGGCASSSGSDSEKGSAKKPEKPDEIALAIPTRVEARKVTIVLGDQWRDAIELKAIRVDRTKPDEWLAKGSAELKLESLSVRASDELKISFLPNHEHLVLHARDVASVERDKEFTHRHRDVAMATIADGELSVFTR
jgi:hypothetical protein